ncbi:MAG: hypothetical protein ACP5H8_01840 [Candidatus Micrarchaeia archaeon]
MIEDEIVHWWKDQESGVQHKTILRIESEEAQLCNGFPRDGKVVIRLINTNSAQAIKLNPDEALRVSTLLLSVAKEVINNKRMLWKKTDSV